MAEIIEVIDEKPDGSFKLKMRDNYFVQRVPSLIKVKFLEGQKMVIQMYDFPFYKNDLFKCTPNPDQQFLVKKIYKYNWWARLKEKFGFKYYKALAVEI